MERRHLRNAVDRPAKIYLAGGEGLVCRIRDISKGGAKIRISWTGWLPDSFDLEDSFTSVRREVWYGESGIWKVADRRRRQRRRLTCLMCAVLFS